MLEVLRRSGVEIHKASARFTADGLPYEAGDWVVLMSQPYRAHAKDLLERQRYPDRRLHPDGPPDTPYDVAGWTLPLQMGVEAVEVQTPFEATLDLETGTIRPAPGRVAGGGATFIVDNAVNAANLAIHRTLSAGGDVALPAEVLEHAGRRWPAGSAVLSGPSVRELMTELAGLEGLSAQSFSGSLIGQRLAQPRVGLYQPWTASMDEGWTRWVFDTWELPYRTVHDAEIRAGGLGARYDAIVLPDLSRESIVEGREPGTVPPEYAGGLGEAGVAAIRAFVKAGGTLVCLGSSSNFAIEALSLPVRDVRPTQEEQRTGRMFYAPGSIFTAQIDPAVPLGYGMPEETAVYYANDPVFEVDRRATEVTVVARYTEAGQLLSGYAIDPDFLSGKAALVEARAGAGRVILFGFRPQHRGQPHETFKLLFNAIYRGAASDSQRLEF